MATALANLEASYANLTARLADITANAKPSYSIDGVSYSWVEYQSFLLTAIEQTKMAIQREQSPFQVISQLRT